MRKGGIERSKKIPESSGDGSEEDVARVLSSGRG